MISEEEVQWIKEYCPTLTVDKNRMEVSGSLKFRATYDSSSGFTWLLEQNQSAPGEIIEDTYEIIISRPKDENKLPILKIIGKDITKNIDRHFYTNKTACLCGVVERRKYLLQNFSFIKYLEQLVVPFLYEQSYYDKYNKWPWGGYAHGAIGIFQSYNNSEGSKEDIEACLEQLYSDKNWKRIRAVLLGQERIKEKSKCFCSNPGQIKKCHPGTWFTMIRFRVAIKNHGIIIK
jgi:hypothetical protein